jgi:hypothetical protein
LNPRHEEDIVDRAVVTPIAEPSDRADARHVDHAVDDHRIVDMHVDDFADHHFIIVLFAAAADEAHRLRVDAFERDRRFRHARRLDLARRRHCELCQLRLADIFRIVAAGHIHLVAQVVGREIEHELAAALGVRLRVLARIRGKHDEGRVARDHIEKAVRREIDHAGRTDGGDPADRARHDEAGRRVVRKFVRLAARVVIHANHPVG